MAIFAAFGPFLSACANYRCISSDLTKRKRGEPRSALFPLLAEKPKFLAGHHKTPS
jgi:hypothetical protein